jgi:hypothetical protein
MTLAVSETHEKSKRTISGRRLLPEGLFFEPAADPVICLTTVNGPPREIHAAEVRAFAPPTVTPHFGNDSAFRSFTDPAKLPIKQCVPKNGHGRSLSQIFTLKRYEPWNALWKLSH